MSLQTPPSLSAPPNMLVPQLLGCLPKRTGPEAGSPWVPMGVKGTPGFHSTVISSEPLLWGPVSHTNLPMATRGRKRGWFHAANPCTKCQDPGGMGTSPLSSRSAQDEIEIGYIQAPHKTMPVVFDSPRNRGLKEFPVKSLMVGAGGGSGG